MPERVVWKYALQQTPATLEESVTVAMPRGAEVLSVQLQRARIHLWALVDPVRPAVSRRFLIRGTGHPVPERAWYLGTVQASALVWHVFEDA